MREKMQEQIVFKNFIADSLEWNQAGRNFSLKAFSK